MVSQWQAVLTLWPNVVYFYKFTYILRILQSKPRQKSGNSSKLPNVRHIRWFRIPEYKNMLQIHAYFDIIYIYSLNRHIYPKHSRAVKRKRILLKKLV